MGMGMRKLYADEIRSVERTIEMVLMYKLSREPPPPAYQSSNGWCLYWDVSQKIFLFWNDNK